MPSRRQLLALPLLLLPVLGLLTSCAFFETTPPDRIFALTPLPPAPLAPTRGLAIVVSEPSALQVLDTARIANRSGLQFQYYSGARWEDRVPAILQTLLIASLRNHLQGDIASDDLTTAGTPLTWSLQDFQVEPDNQIHITLVVNFAGATQTFETRQTAASDKMDDLAAAFDDGAHVVLSEMIQWIEGSIR